MTSFLYVWLVLLGRRDYSTYRHWNMFNSYKQLHT